MSANDGERFRASVGTRSVFVPRWGEEIKAFENRCAHRSFPLRNAQKGNGSVGCGIHRWRYAAISHPSAARTSKGRNGLINKVL
jgi:nitrite reductase/ring-hydroxylating ferredoxin subunit